MDTTKTSAERTSRVTESPLLMTEQEAAELLGFSPRTLQGWRVTGGGPRYIKVSERCVRYRREDLTEWIEERARCSTSDPG